MNREAVLNRGFLQSVEVTLGVVGAKKYLAAVIATLDHVDGLAWQKYAGTARHGLIRTWYNINNCTRYELIV